MAEYNPGAFVGPKGMAQKQYFLSLGGNKASFLFIAFAHLNLMATLAGAKAHDKIFTRSRTNTADCIVAKGYWKFKRFRDLVKCPIGYVHTPYKIVNVGNVLLAGLCC